MSERIGFIGLGKMGLPMARNLLKAGFELRVYNRNPARAEALVAQGGQQVFHPGEVAQPGGMVVSMVSDDAALEQVVLGTDGLLERLGPDGVHLSMSTVSPATARRLADLHDRLGSRYVAAPVLGRPEAAAAQQLAILISGARVAKERVYPLLQALGQGIFDFGEEPGAANVVKLANNFLVAAALEAMAEALTLAEKNGIDRSQVIDLIGRTGFSSPVYQNYGKAIAQQRYTPAGFYLSLGLKDIDLVLQTANEGEMPMPFASFLHDRLLASVAKGRGDMDWSALALGVSEDAGMQQDT